MQTYQVKLTIQANSHPRKWLFDAIAEVLEQGEDILEHEIEIIEVPEQTETKEV